MALTADGEVHSRDSAFYRKMHTRIFPGHLPPARKPTELGFGIMQTRNIFFSPRYGPSASRNNGRDPRSGILTSRECCGIVECENFPNDPIEMTTQLKGVGDGCLGGWLSYGSRFSG